MCAQKRTCQKVNEDFSKQMWTSRIIQTLIVQLQAFKDLYNHKKQENMRKFEKFEKKNYLRY